MILIPENRAALASQQHCTRIYHSRFDCSILHQCFLASLPKVWLMGVTIERCTTKYFYHYYYLPYLSRPILTYYVWRYSSPTSFSCTHLINKSVWIAVAMSWRKRNDPDTNTSAPACLTKATISLFTPPSTMT